ncbi:LysM peptidoglycan-binding domain-containing protein [Bacillus sp. DTU_2020_1000418_1_SI_GHA_SEK_038]|uniref:LysM peptidoglycan-binding domain-containing protein n=1 Tax=Bacillus sp. DTU_2020_1000418_1_SI_GHA_SEK_038 TaxID=3077585 RepID=UPI0028ED4900|nr:LysM peptidoglycan-binding domain-containing protein [Bacillus sp. DTU_2020_1000418_1_SI_GHA_SEK_038]WNS74072.1 LysM peptidoglycan-binding domain-containing protein [Bacillus sp. DTU_2020_1000418_1_SI_GHA_SEK_038]
MNKEGPYRDQAERLRKKVDRNWDNEDPVLEKETLPPRSRLHREKRKKNKWKVKYPVIRLLALLFILLPITIFTMYNYLQKNENGGAEKASTQTGYETIGFEELEDKDAKGTIIEEREEDPVNTNDQGKSEDRESAIPASETPVISDSEDKGSAKPSETVENEQVKDEQQSEQKELIYHTVKPNETIFRIAMNYYQSKAGIDIIKKANNLKNDEIQAGQVLKIPK